jgi:subfamily B ATP-binding cassette protein MsbA
MTTVPPKKGSFRTYLRLLAYLAPHRSRLLFALLLMLVSAGAATYMMFLLKPIMDGTFGKVDDPLAALHRLWAFTLPLFLGVSFLRYGSAYGQNYLMGYLSQRVVQRLRADLYRHFLELPLSFFTAQRTGGMSSRIINDVLILQNSVTNVVGSALSSSLTSVGLVGLLFFLNWRLALIAVLVFPLAVYPISRFGKRLRRSSGEGQQLTADLSAHVQETLSGIRVVKGFGQETHERRRFDAVNDSIFGVAMHQVRAIAASGPIVETATTLFSALLIGWLARRVLIAQDLTIGDFVAFAGTVASLYPHLRNFNGLWGSLQQALAAAERCFEVLDTPNAQADPHGAAAVEPLTRALEFRKVCFEYHPGHPVLRDVSFSVRKGEIVAVVGPSGSGKTTLADLIAKFYLPTSGAILWDGEDLKGVKTASLRSHIGIVTQETILFNDSILGNISYGKPGAPLPEVLKAAEAAYAREFIDNTPQGFNTVVGERGAKLSGGQRQRLAIARALIKNPPFLILDEATSALDTQSERLVQKALDSLMSRRTTLVIAHRLSTVRRAHRILVLDKGRIVEQGRHADLVKRKGLYSRLHKMQFHAVKP